MTRAIAARIREALGDDGSGVFAFGAALTLLPPGSRKDNRYWLVRGTLGDGRRIEVSSKTTDGARARRFARELARCCAEMGAAARQPA